MAGGGFFKKNTNLEKKMFHLILKHSIFLCFYCSIDVQKQSEHSGLRPDMSSFVTLFDENCWMIID